MHIENEDSEREGSEDFDDEGSVVHEESIWEIYCEDSSDEDEALDELRDNDRHRVMISSCK